MVAAGEADRVVAVVAGEAEAGDQAEGDRAVVAVGMEAQREL